MESNLMKVLGLIWRLPATTPRNYGFLKRIMSANDVVSDPLKAQQEVKSCDQWLWYYMLRQEPHKIMVYVANFYG